MFLQHLTLLNYKNISSQSFDFDNKINCFVGANGVGKTNVLDAIYHLSFGKSYFNPVATQNIRHDEEFFVIDGVFDKEDRAEKIIVSLKKGQKKIIKRNGKIYEKFSDHIGFIPLVIISPADSDPAKTRPDPASPAPGACWAPECATKPGPAPSPSSAPP